MFVRLTLLTAYLYFGVWIILYPTCGLIYKSTDANWWKPEEKAFFTNASVYNAVFAWIAFCVFWFLFLYFSLCLVMLVLGSICDKSFRTEILGKLINGFFLDYVPKSFYRYVLGLSED